MSLYVSSAKGFTITLELKMTASEPSASTAPMLQQWSYRCLPLSMLSFNSGYT